MYESPSWCVIELAFGNRVNVSADLTNDKFLLIIPLTLGPFRVFSKTKIFFMYVLVVFFNRICLSTQIPETDLKMLTSTNRKCNCTACSLWYHEPLLSSHSKTSFFSHPHKNDKPLLKKKVSKTMYLCGREAKTVKFENTQIQYNVCVNGVLTFLRGLPEFCLLGVT